MKILYLSPVQHSLGIAQKLQDQGNKVIVWHIKESDPIHKGMVAGHTTEWKNIAHKFDLLVYDDVMELDPDTELWPLDKPTVSGNRMFSRLENDRIFGKD